MIRRLVLITNRKGDATPHSLALVRKLKALRLLKHIDYVTRETPCWIHSSAFMQIKSGNCERTVSSHEEIVDLLLEADKK
jgi:hypothetical protein